MTAGQRRERLRKGYHFLWGLTIPSMILSILILIIVLDKSSNYIKPKLLAFNPADETMVFTRTVTKDVIAEWTHEIITEDGLECSAAGRTFYARDDGPKTITFPVPESLIPCLTDGNYRHTIAWQVVRWGGVRLAPVTMTLTKIDEQRDLKSYIQRQLILTPDE